MAATFSASAFDRPFPAGTKRGKMTPDLYPAIVINGKARVLSPGAKLWNENNTIEMPAYLSNQEYVINYTENADGQIDRIWILTPAEAHMPASALPKK